MRSSAAAEQFSNRGEKKEEEDPASRNKEMEDLSLTMSQRQLGALRNLPGEKRNDEKPSTDAAVVMAIAWSDVDRRGDRVCLGCSISRGDGVFHRLCSLLLSLVVHQCTAIGSCVWITSRLRVGRSGSGSGSSSSSRFVFSISCRSLFLGSPRWALLCMVFHCYYLLFICLSCRFAKLVLFLSSLYYYILCLGCRCSLMLLLGCCMCCY